MVLVQNWFGSKIDWGPNGLTPNFRHVKDFRNSVVAITWLASKIGVKDRSGSKINLTQKMVWVDNGSGPELGVGKNWLKP